MLSARRLLVSARDTDVQATQGDPRVAFANRALIPLPSFEPTVAGFSHDTTGDTISIVLSRKRTSYEVPDLPIARSKSMDPLCLQKAGRKDAPTILLLHGLPSRGVPARTHDGHRARNLASYSLRGSLSFLCRPGG